LFLSVANTSSTATIGARSSLTGNTLEVGEALAYTSFTIAVTLVGAFHDWMDVISVGNVSYPCRRLGASSRRAISISPCGLAIFSVVAVANIVDIATTVTIATIRTSGIDNGDHYDHGRDNHH